MEKSVRVTEYVIVECPHCRNCSDSWEDTDTALEDIARYNDDYKSWKCNRCNKYFSE